MKKFYIENKILVITPKKNTINYLFLEDYYNLIN